MNPRDIRHNRARSVTRQGRERRIGDEATDRYRAVAARPLGCPVVGSGRSCGCGDERDRADVRRALASPNPRHSRRCRCRSHARPRRRSHGGRSPRRGRGDLICAARRGRRSRGLGGWWDRWNRCGRYRVGSRGAGAEPAPHVLLDRIARRSRPLGGGARRRCCGRGGRLRHATRARSSGRCGGTRGTIEGAGRETSGARRIPVRGADARGGRGGHGRERALGDRCPRWRPRAAGRERARDRRSGRRSRANAAARFADAADHPRSDRDGRARGSSGVGAAER